MFDGDDRTTRPGDKSRDRSSVADAALIPTDPQELALREAENGLRQTDDVHRQIVAALEESVFRLRPSDILLLNRVALEGLSPYAGIFRPEGVSITGSKHEPPPATRVARLTEDFCDYVNANWNSASALHLASYCMWRLNWIHPFVDGNGRTTRAVSYIVFCVKIGFPLPGVKTIPEQIAENKDPYYQALEAADAAEKCGETNLRPMEELLESLFAVQLLYLRDLSKSES